MKDLIEIRQGNSSDANFILNSWLKSYRESEFGSDIPKHTYFVGHHELVTKAIQRSQVFCAVSKEDSSQIYGWICLEPGKESKVPSLHYCYVKHPYRGWGIARSLLLHALDQELFSFSHLPDGKFHRLLNKHGHYDPYRFFGGEK
jgi:GNAT superfamily N-acetyltransferase